MLSLSARAAARAYEPPEPIAKIPSSGSIMSPVPEDHEPVLAVCDGKQRLQSTQHPIASPVLGELDGRARKIAGVPLQLFLELFEEREGVGRRARKAGQQLAASESAHLLRVRLHDRFADGDLSVTPQRELPVAAHGQDGCGIDRRES